MVRFYTLAAYALLQSLAAAASLSSYSPNYPNGLSQTTSAHLTPAQVKRELGPLLSNSSSILGPRDAGWEDATARYQAYMPPEIEVVVRVGVEADVSTVIKYANHNSIPFLAVNRAHGFTSSLGSFRGIQIDLTLLTDITVRPDKNTALLQGGTFDQQVIDDLWEQGYVATTGSCGCVGMLGPGLGGGHGRYQGLYGLISDNFVQLNVVLANGTAIVVSDTSNPDLFWAMKGAGHNFGIVTSYELKIYPRLADTWYYRNYVFTEDKLELLFDELNTLGGNGTQPKEMAYTQGGYHLDPAVSETKAVISWSFQYAGSEADAERYLTPFNNLGPINVTGGNVPYPQIPGATGTGVDDPVCGTGNQDMLFTAGLQVFNLTTQRQLYELFNSKIHDNPALSSAFMIMEGYSVDAVRAVDPDSSAFPLRDDYLLVALSISYPPDPSQDEYAIQWGEQSRRLWNQGQPTRRPHTYVNYAFNNEPLESIYGYEPWRLERLRALKKKYDPHNRFRYYVPIMR